MNKSKRSQIKRDLRNLDRADSAEEEAENLRRDQEEKSAGQRKAEKAGRAGNILVRMEDDALEIIRNARKSSVEDLIAARENLQKLSEKYAKGIDDSNTEKGKQKFTELRDGVNENLGKLNEITDSINGLKNIERSIEDRVENLQSAKTGSEKRAEELKDEAEELGKSAESKEKEAAGRRATTKKRMSRSEKTPDSEPAVSGPESTTAPAA